MPGPGGVSYPIKTKPRRYLCDINICKRLDQLPAPPWLTGVYINLFARQTPASRSAIYPKQMVAVMPVRVAAYLFKQIANLLRSDPQPLLLLPLLPAVNPTCAKHCNKDHHHHHFYQAEAMFFCFHGDIVPTARFFATGKGLFFENSRRKVLLLQ